MENYYEILEVSEKASKEVVEKAYKTLAKKYHPDVQEEGMKQESENRMKLINEAYDVLSDGNKRMEYDMELRETKRQEQLEELQRLQRQQRPQRQGYDTYPPNYDINNGQANNIPNNANYNDQYIRQQDQEELNRAYQESLRQRQARLEYETQKAYNDAYENYLRGLGYKIKHRWTFKEVLTIFLVIVGLIFICFILWIFPPTRRLFIDMYETNMIVKTIVDIFILTFKPK